MGDNLIPVTCHQPSLKEALTAHPAGINDWWLNVVCELAFITCGMVSTGLHSLLTIFIDALRLSIIKKYYQKKTYLYACLHIQVDDNK